MKIALLGYGKMGKAIEADALKRGHSIILRIDSEHDWNKNVSLLPRADVAIEFSLPEIAAKNIRRCFDARIPVVVGTTGWEQHLNAIKKACLEGKHALFLASNFSIGMNIFFEVNKQLARLMNQFDQFDVEIEELHHKHKIDAPSGTAKVLADQIISNVHRKKKWMSGPDVASDELRVTSLREDEAPGRHKISYISGMEVIDIVHTATDRKVFAEGAVKAAEWLVGRVGIFGMRDILLDES